MRDQLTTTRDEGIWRKKNGILVVRAQVNGKDLSKTLTPGKRGVPAGLSGEAYRRYAQEALASLRSDSLRSVYVGAVSGSKKFTPYAESRIQLRRDRGDVVASTDRRYKSELKFLDAEWGKRSVEDIQRDEVEQWMGRLGKLCQAGEYTPNYINGIWGTFKMIMSDASIAFKIANPCERIHAISTASHETYTIDEPNALDMKELANFLYEGRIVRPRFIACFTLGFLTGRRTCELRPLRADGPEADLDWDTGRLLVRRSQVYGEPTNRLKQHRHGAKNKVLAWLPKKPLLGLMEWHYDHLTDFQRATNLLFPPLKTNHLDREQKLAIVAEARERGVTVVADERSLHRKSIHQWMRGEALGNDNGREASGYMARNALAEPIEAICKAAKIKKHITPRAMRRTYQDLCRAAGVSTFIQKSMSGHATEKMLQLYSTQGEDEGRRALMSMSEVAGLA